MRTLFFLCSCIVLGIIACSSSAGSEWKDKWQKSLEAWQQAKQQCGNNYQYTLVCISGEGMFSTYVDVVVRQGKVVSTVRYVVKWDNKGNRKESERDSSLLKNFSDAPIGTIDDMYEFARREVFTKKAADYHLYFETDERNLLKTAGYYNKRMADACLSGYELKTLVLGESDENASAEGTPSELYGTWELVEVKGELWVQSDYRSTDQKLFKVKDYQQKFQISFHAKEGFGYNLDVNSCGSTFKVAANNRLKIAPGGGCTEACCDTVGFPFWGDLYYSIENDKLTLKNGDIELIYKKVKN